MTPEDVKDAVSRAWNSGHNVIVVFSNERQLPFGGRVSKIEEGRFEVSPHPSNADPRWISFSEVKTIQEIYAPGGSDELHKQ